MKGREPRARLPSLSPVIAPVATPPARRAARPGVQKKAQVASGAARDAGYGAIVEAAQAIDPPPSARRIRDAAAEGVRGPSAKLPHLDAIQRSFGHHDVGGVAAHTGDRAARAARSIDAVAYTDGAHVAFAGTPSLHTAAHEAAHAVQQRSGVHLQGGVGQAGDAHEQHADAVAATVVAGRSAEPLLDRYARADAAPVAAVQRKPFAFKAVNEDKRGKRPTPVEISKELFKIHGVLGKIGAADDMVLRFSVDYAGGENHGGTKIAHVAGTTMFLVTIYWGPDESYEAMAATLVHEVAIHVLPAVVKHEKAKAEGTLGADTFPSEKADVLKAEEAEHNHPGLWKHALTAARKVNKGVVQTVVRDMAVHIGAVNAAKVCAEEGMPETVFFKCMEGTFAAVPPANDEKKKGSGKGNAPPPVMEEVRTLVLDDMAFSFKPDEIDSAGDCFFDTVIALGLAGGRNVDQLRALALAHGGRAAITTKKEWAQGQDITALGNALGVRFVVAALDMAYKPNQISRYGDGGPVHYIAHIFGGHFVPMRPKKK